MTEPTNTDATASAGSTPATGATSQTPSPSPASGAPAGDEASGKGVGAGNDPNASTGSQAPARPAWAPEKFWDVEAGQLRGEDLAKSYGELERWRAGRGSAPETYARPQFLAGDDQIARFPDQVLQEVLAPLARTEGMTQAGYDQLARMILGDPEQLRTELDQAWGAEAQTRARAVEQFAQTLMQTEDYRSDVASLLTTAGGYKLLESLLRQGADKQLPSGEAAGGGAPPVTAESLAALQRDPRYWRDKDPAIIRQVEEGYRKLYPGTVQAAPINATRGAAA